VCVGRLVRAPKLEPSPVEEERGVFRRRRAPAYPPPHLLRGPDYAPRPEGREFVYRSAQVLIRSIGLRETEYSPFIGNLKRDREPSDPLVVSHAYIESQPGRTAYYDESCT
jgi:hypothetical protein